MPKAKSGSGRKSRKPGDWIAIAKGRLNRDREIVHRGNRDMPDMSHIGSAAYRRLVQKQARHG